MQRSSLEIQEPAGAAMGAEAPPLPAGGQASGGKLGALELELQTSLKASEEGKADELGAELEAEAQRHSEYRAPGGGLGLSAVPAISAAARHMRAHSLCTLDLPPTLHAHTQAPGARAWGTSSRP